MFENRNCHRKIWNSINRGRNYSFSNSIQFEILIQYIPFNSLFVISKYIERDGRSNFDYIEIRPVTSWSENLLIKHEIAETEIKFHGSWFNFKWKIKLIQICVGTTKCLLEKANILWINSENDFLQESNIQGIKHGN